MSHLGFPSLFRAVGRQFVLRTLVLVVLFFFFFNYYSPLFKQNAKRQNDCHILSHILPPLHHLTAELERAVSKREHAAACAHPGSYQTQCRDGR